MPRVGLARGEAFLLEAHGDGLVVDFHIAIEGGVVPRVALGSAALAVRALGEVFLKLGKNALRFLAEAEGDMDGVHSDFSACVRVAFPIGGLGVVLGAELHSGDLGEPLK